MPPNSPFGGPSSGRRLRRRGAILILYVHHERGVVRKVHRKECRRNPLFRGTPRRGAACGGAALFGFCRCTTKEGMVWKVHRKECRRNPLFGGTPRRGAPCGGPAQFEIGRCAKTKQGKTKVIPCFVVHRKEFESLAFGSVAMLFGCFLPLFDSPLLIHKTHKKQAKKRG